MAASGGRQGPDRVLTVPNVLTTSRLLLLVVFLLLLFGSNNRVVACVVLAVAGATDFLDGYIARRFHQESALGKILDPSVDRAVLVAAILALVTYGAIPVWLAIVLVAREVLVSSTALVLAAVGARRIDVLFIGKVGTFGLMVSLPLLLLGHGRGSVAHALGASGWVLVAPSLVCAWIAAGAYLPVARQSLATRREAVLTPGASR